MTDQRNHPAFPCEAQYDRSVQPEHDYIQNGMYSGKFPGITIRDWFAGKALGNPEICTGTAQEHDLRRWFGDARTGIRAWEVAAKQAFEYADAMLAARTTP